MIGEVISSAPISTPLWNAAGAGAYTLVADAGAFTISGTAASLKAGRVIQAGAGSFAVTGTAAGLLASRRLVCESGSFVISGTAAALRRGYPLIALPGSYSITGTAITFRRSYRLAAESGSYSITGSAVNLVYTPVAQPAPAVELPSGNIGSHVILPYDLLCVPRKMINRSDISDFCERFDYVRSISSLLGADVRDLLDVDADSEVSLFDRDYWLNKELLEALPAGTVRLPWGVGESDPLNIYAGRTNVIIIDPDNAQAVDVTRGAMTCKFSDGSSAGNLFDGGGTGNNYLRRIWRGPQSLDEFALGGLVGPSTVRRFPASGGEILIVFRGGEYVMDWPIGFCRNNAAWAKLDRIVVRNYPGEKVSIRSGSALIPDGPGAGKYHMGFDSGHIFSRRIRRDNVTFDGIEFIGNRVSGANRIFDPAMFYIEATDFHDGQPIENVTLQNLRIVDCLGISPSHPQAGSFPQYIDAAYGDESGSGSRYDYAFGVPVNSQTIPQALIISHGRNTKILDCFARVAPTDFPMVDAQLGEGVLLSSSATDCLVSRLTVEGLTPHNGLVSGGNNNIIEHSDLENFHDTPLGLGGTGWIVRYCRLKKITHQNGKLGNIAQVTPASGTASGRFHNNVLWGFANAGASGVANNGLALSPVVGGTFVEVEYDHNIFYKAGVYMGGADGSVRLSRGHDNAFYDLPIWNTLPSQSALFNAPIIVDFAGTIVANGFWGNELRNNLLFRSDAIAQFLVEVGVPSTFYNLAGLNGLPNCSGNFTSDPLFKDAANGNFTLLPGSPLAGVIGYPTPFAEILENPRDLAVICLPIWTPRFGRIRYPRLRGSSRVS